MKDQTKGICYLAGAGPGDVGLVTLRTKERVEQADVIIYDYLCNPAILQWARPEAEIIYAGKKAGNHTLPQEEISSLLVKHASAGKKVLRLKGGDPFLFGRGGEEAEALAAAGLKFEIIPGVSSVLAAPAYAGFPLTHRDFSSQVTVFTGHENPDKEQGAVDLARIASAPGTKVMLMGVERLEPICRGMMEAGADPALPVALIRWATTPRQQTLTGVLSDIAAKAADQKFAAPAVAVFGQVVQLREQLHWFEDRPLFGKRIIVTRTRQQAGELSQRLIELGADVWELPTIKLEEPTEKRLFYELVRDAHGYDWLLFTSPNGVHAFFHAYYQLYKDAREIGGVRIAAIGPATAKAVREYRLAVDLQPDEYVAEGIIAKFKKQGDIENLRVLLVRAEVARDVLPHKLTEMGAIVDEAPAYRTVPANQDSAAAAEQMEAMGADVVTFTSSSTVDSFMAMGLPLPKNLKIASIGPVTSRTVEKHGLKVDIEAFPHDVAGLADAVRLLLQQKQP